jgi:hypothetical protein
VRGQQRPQAGRVACLDRVSELFHYRQYIVLVRL